MSGNVGAKDAMPYQDTDKHHRKSDVSHQELADDLKVPEDTAHSLAEPSDDIFAQALARYPNDESIDTREEKRVRRKLDALILPVLGICYFFYYVDKTTLYVYLRLNLEVYDALLNNADTFA